MQRMIQDYFEHHMERLIVGQTLSAGTEGGGLGGTGVAKLHEDTKFQLLQFDADNLAETLTDDLVGPMLRLNVPSADFGIRFEFNVESPENADKMEAVSKAVSMGVTFKMDEVRELTGMSRPEEGEETIGGGRKESHGEHARQQDHAGEQVEYAKNPAFEEIHPRDLVGRFAEKAHRSETQVSADDMSEEPKKAPPDSGPQQSKEIIDAKKADEFSKGAIFADELLRKDYDENLKGKAKVVQNITRLEGKKRTAAEDKELDEFKTLEGMYVASLEGIESLLKLQDDRRVTLNVKYVLGDTAVEFARDVAREGAAGGIRPLKGKNALYLSQVLVCWSFRHLRVSVY